MFTRAYEPLESQLRPGKALVIYGPRRVGKTTLLNTYLQKTPLKYKLVSGDDIEVRNILGSQSFSQILPFVEDMELLAIDEAQNIPNIGMGIKIIVDQKPELTVIVTGSSSFELAGQIGEPLTGRKRTLVLYPMSQSELRLVHNRYDLQQKLPELLIYGSYPEILLAKSRRERQEILTDIANSYLLKDILSLDLIKNSQTLWNLLKLLAFQIGNQVSYSELATQLAVDYKSIQKYLDLLEKAFVIFRLGAYNGNLRKEVTGKSKYYFVDTGIRNAVISQFGTMENRNDIGALWENFMFIERLKYRTYTGIYANSYYWRTYSKQEIDLVEERDGNLFGFEFKWSEKKSIPAPREWVAAYPNAIYNLIHPGNYLDIIT